MSQKKLLNYRPSAVDWCTTRCELVLTGRSQLFHCLWTSANQHRISVLLWHCDSASCRSTVRHCRRPWRHTAHGRRRYHIHESFARCRYVAVVTGARSGTNSSPPLIDSYWLIEARCASADPNHTTRVASRDLFDLTLAHQAVHSFLTFLTNALRCMWLWDIVFLRLRNILTYLLTYLLTYMGTPCPSVQYLSRRRQLAWQCVIDLGFFFSPGITTGMLAESSMRSAWPTPT